MLLKLHASKRKRCIVKSRVSQNFDTQHCSFLKQNIQVLNHLPDPVATLFSRIVVTRKTFKEGIRSDESSYDILNKLLFEPKHFAWKYIRELAKFNFFAQPNFRKLGKERKKLILQKFKLLMVYIYIYSLFKIIQDKKRREGNRSREKIHMSMMDVTNMETPIKNVIISIPNNAIATDNPMVNLKPNAIK